jgi:hypothetical protein
LEQPSVELAAFSDAMTDLADDWMRDDSSVHQVLTVATAVKDAGVSLDSLTLFYVSHQIFELSSSDFLALVRPLRRLRILTHVSLPLDDTELECGRIPDAQYVARAKQFRELFAEARNLRILNLELHLISRFSPGNKMPRGARLEDAIGDTTYSHLYELSIGHCEVEAGFLIDLILRHKATLRRLSLFDISLTNEGPTAIDWRTVFTTLSAQLPHLRIVRLGGEFDRNEIVEFFCDDNYIWVEALQNFIFKGGEWPLYIPNPSKRTFRPPRLEISNDDMEMDDPAQDYKHDEFGWFL